jgi:hypothetical protein
VDVVNLVAGPALGVATAPPTQYQVSTLTRRGLLHYTSQAGYIVTRISDIYFYNRETGN